MSWMNEIGSILQRYGGAGTSSAPSEVHEDFSQVAKAAPQPAVADGLAESFRSDQTPPFGQMVSQLFNQSDGQQKAGLLNRLLQSVGPGALTQLPGLGSLAGLLQGGAQVTPEQAQQVSPQAVEQIAAHAEQKNPSIVDEVSGFYAQHPDVVKALGGLALSIMISKMVRR